MSGNNLTINTNNLLNDASNMQAFNNVLVNTINFNNTSYYIREGTSEQYVGKKRWWTRDFIIVDPSNPSLEQTNDCGKDGWNCWDGGNWNYNSEKKTITKEYNMKSQVIAGGTVSIAATNNINNRLELSGQDVSNSNLYDNNPKIENPELKEIKNSGIIDPMDFIEMPQGDYGIFRKPTDPNSKYLFETDPSLLNISNFLGSEYFLSRIGVDPDSINLKILGDSYMEEKILERMLSQYLTNNEFMKQSLESKIEEMYNNVDKNLVDRLGLEVATALNEEQLNSLDKDIIWYVKQGITLDDGTVVKDVLVPQIFLSKDSRDAIDITNSGSMIAGNNMIINTGNSLTNNNGSKIAAENNVNIGTVALEDYFHKVTKSGGGLSTRKKKTETEYNSNNVGSELFANNIQIESGNNINVQGSDIVSISGTNLIVGNDVNIFSALDSSYSNTTTKKRKIDGAGSIRSNSNSTKNNIKSNLTTKNSNINIVLGNNTNVIASELSTIEGGDVNVFAGYEIDSTTGA